jgi:hypothetical protein
MRSMSMLQLVGGVAVAGAVAAGATAFTATAGITQTSASQFVGGSVTQAVTGAGNVNSIAYTWANAPANTQLTTAVVTFAAAVPAGKSVTVTPGGGSYTAPANSMSCTANAGRDVWTCITQDSGTAGVLAGNYAGLDSFQVTVS